MRFRPRHYLLILVIIGLGIYNYTRTRRSHTPELTSAPARSSAPQSPGTSPAWPAFDAAAKTRDADDDNFQPALKSLSTAIDTTPQTADDLPDLKGCRTWLLFYRQEHLHPAINKPGWAQQLTSHVDSCLAHHRDISE